MHPEIYEFDHQPRTRIVFGANTIERLGDLARQITEGTVFIVTDQGIVKAGHVERALNSLRKAGLQTVIYSDVNENPTTRDVDDCLEVAHEANVSLIVGIGGGSSLDTAKGCNFLLTNGGRMQDYWGVGKASKPMLPLIAIPTTAGTGSECQSFALISDEVTHAKMACGDPKAAARIAILDPTLTVSQPPMVSACTGIDAIAHALETAVTTKRNPISSLYSREAFRLLSSNFARVIQSPDDLDARTAMLLGAAWAGTAIEASMLGAAHSAANPLTAKFNMIHGQAVGLLLPQVVRFNAQMPVIASIYKDLSAAAGITDFSSTPSLAAEELAQYLISLLLAAKLPTTLSDFGVGESDLPALSELAAEQWTAKFNPRRISTEDFASIYRQVLV